MNMIFILFYRPRRFGWSIAGFYSSEIVVGNGDNDLILADCANDPILHVQHHRGNVVWKILRFCENARHLYECGPLHWLDWENRLAVNCWQYVCVTVETSWRCGLATHTHTTRVSVQFYYNSISKCSAIQFKIKCIYQPHRHCLVSRHRECIVIKDRPINGMKSSVDEVIAFDNTSSETSKRNLIFQMAP